MSPEQKYYFDKTNSELVDLKVMAIGLSTASRNVRQSVFTSSEITDEAEFSESESYTIVYGDISIDILLFHGIISAIVSFTETVEEIIRIDEGIGNRILELLHTIRDAKLK